MGLYNSYIILYNIYIIQKVKKMGIFDDIKNAKRRTARPKWKILKEDYGDAIEQMIKEGIPITEQIRILLKNKAVEKLYYKEYYDILCRRFGYKGRVLKFRPKEEDEPSARPAKKEGRQQQVKRKETRRRDPVSALEEDADLLDFV